MDLAVRSDMMTLLILSLRSQRKDVGLQLLTDFFDLAVLSSALGYSNFGEPLLGFSGTMSGAIGAWRVWQKTASP
jgi:hypothetical protein